MNNPLTRKIRPLAKQLNLVFKGFVILDIPVLVHLPKSGFVLMLCWTEPHVHLLSVRIYLAHHADLMVALGYIGLIDTNNIYPNNALSNSFS